MISAGSEKDCPDVRCLTFTTDLSSIYPEISISPGNNAGPYLPDLYHLGRDENFQQDGLRITHLISPLIWSRTRKHITLSIACFATVFASVAASAYAPGQSQMQQAWNVSQVASASGITVFTMGFAIAPMATAPFSELRGRKPVFLVMGVLYVVCTVCCAVSQSFGGMIAARIFQGVSSSTFSTMIGGVITDIYRSDERDAAMSLFAGSAIFGVGFGAVIAGFIARYTTWRWIFGFQAIINAFLVILFVFYIGETREDTILRQKADTLNKWERSLEEKGQLNGRHLIVWRSALGDEQPDLKSMIATSLTRPFQLLFTEPVVTAFSLWVGFSWSVLYICLSIIPVAFQDIYSMEPQQSTAFFTASCVGTVLATIIGIYHERIARHFDLLPSTPEARLYCCCIEGWLLPIGLFMFGWTATPTVHWIIPSIAIALATMGIFFVLLTTFNYFADNYGPYASSAIAAQSFCRNAIGGAFPLVTRQMYSGLGYGPASSLCGGIAAALGLVPLVLLLYGERIRERSRFAKALAS